MTANTPPKPHAEGDKFTNTETGITYEFKSGAWRAVSSEAADAVVDAISELNLEKVLTAGNVADKDIVLTDGIDDLIDISPTEGRIIIASDADLKTPKITLAHFGDHDDGNRKAEIELDENGTRLDFELSGDVKDVHFRFGDDEKFIINHEGDAEFVGKVKVEPGTEDNEVVTYGQLVTVAEEQFVSKTGDTITGTMVIRPDTGKHGLTVYPGPEAIGTTTDIFTARKYDGRQVLYADQNGDVGVDPAWSPTKDQHLATKKYVDEYIAMQGGGPTKCSWIFEQSPGFPTEGKMTTLNVQPETGNLIYLSYLPHSGISMFSDRKNVEYFNASSNIGQPLITIWDLVESGYRHKYTASISRIKQNGSGHFEITVGDFIGENANLKDDTECWVAIGGFF